MKWKHNSPPEVGDIRNRAGFLFMPRRIGDETRWLEYAEWSEVYHKPMNYPGHVVLAQWVGSRWMDEKYPRPRPVVIGSKRGGGE